MSTFELATEIFVDRPPAFVGRFLADLAQTPSWRPSVVQATPLASGPIQLGNAVELRLHYGLSDFGIRYQLAAFEETSHIAWRGLATHYTIDEDFQLAAREGGCTISWRVRIDLPSPMTSRLLSRWLRAEQRAAFAALPKALSELPSDWRPSFWQRLGDHLVLPNVWTYTRLGYARHKQHWHDSLLDLQGQTLIITGATTELGSAAARALAKRGAQLILVARHEKKARLLQDIIASEGSLRPYFEAADLTLVASTRALAERLLARGQSYDGLINNAGRQYQRRVVTAEGLERSFASLLLCPFVLGEALRPALRDGARIVNVASAALYMQGLRLDDLESEQDLYQGYKAFARAKRGLLDLSCVWAARWPTLSVSCMHPGWSQLPPHMRGPWVESSKNWLRTPEQAADTIVWLMAAPGLTQASGLLWFDRRPRPTALLPGTQSSRAEQQTLYAQLAAYADSLAKS